MGTTLIACPSCACHAFARETHCPNCGAELRASDGSLQRTAGAVLLGLTLTVTAAACSNDVSTGDGGKGGQGGAGGATTTTTSTDSGMGGFQAVSAYGVGPGGFGPSTTSGPGGAGGTGGQGGSGGG